jgi:methionyl-tRNA formyltransferase
MLEIVKIDISDDMTGGDLHDALAELGPGALARVLEDLPKAQAHAQVQDDARATYAHKIEKHDLAIDWSLDADTLARKIRAFTPAPCCFAELADDRIKLWQATAVPGNSGESPGTIISADKSGIDVACGSGTLRLTRAQVPGGKPLSAAELVNGQRERFLPGSHFSPLSAS